MALFGGAEIGGTKIICAIGNHPDHLPITHRFSTTTPAQNTEEIIDFFKTQHRKSPLDAIGIASFGPVDPNPDSPDYGFITSTPKPNWANTDILSPIQNAFDIPIAFDTDVNGAALGESRWGAAQNLHTFIYLTIGTGIGGGGLINGEPMHGLLHPEMGHILLPHNWEEDPFPGFCPFHGDCLEGLAAGPAIAQRWGQPAETLPPEHPAWELEAHYIALGLANHILTISPQRIILGGGVMEQSHLFPMIHTKVKQVLNRYVAHDNILKNIDQYIVPPMLKNHAGVLGAIALAQRQIGIFKSNQY